MNEQPRASRLRARARWLCLVALAACAGSDDDDRVAGAGEDDASKVDAFVAASCDWFRSCCEQAGKPVEPLMDCEQRGHDDPDLLNAVRDGSISVLEPAFSECIDALRSGRRSCAVSGPGTDVCAPIFRGRRAVGEACDSVIQCRQDSGPVLCLRKNPAGDDTPGVCHKLARGHAGDSCLFSAASQSGGVTYTIYGGDEAALAYCDTRDGLYCTLPSAPATCQPLIAEGSPCSQLGCAPDLYCDQTCKPSKAEGEACASSVECKLPAFLCKAGRCAIPQVVDSELCEGNFD